MIYRFEKFELDSAQRELRVEGEPRAIQPQVFDLIELLLTNSARMVSKDEVVEKVWDGRFISDAALNSCVRLARQALDDDGKQQRVIKTKYGSGFRFVAELSSRSPRVSIPGDRREDQQPDFHQTAGQRPSIAVLPFALIGADQAQAAIAEAVPAELISALSRLRWLKVIARGSSFQFRDQMPELSGVGQKLNADYILTGRVELLGKELSLCIELNDARDSSVLWVDRLTGNIDSVFELRQKAASEVVNALEFQIPEHEAERLRFRTSENLTAWGHYHLGVRHMYRYNKADNIIAEQHLSKALAFDPDFARAQAARSYTEFLNHFLMFGDDPEQNRSLALRHAERAVELDPLDPFCALMLGRVKWLYDEVEDGLGWIERSLTINPNSSFAHYNSALLQTVLCDGHSAAFNVENAMALSPLDPHLQSMLGTRAMAAYVSDDIVSAQQYADRAVRAPNPHLYVFVIAAAIYAHVGEEAKAKACVERLRSTEARFGKAEFLNHYNLRDHSKLNNLEQALTKLGV